MDVNVIPVPEPVVHISGTSDISREYEDFKLGVRIFADVHIVMTTGSPTGNGMFFSKTYFSQISDRARTSFSKNEIHILF